MRTSLCFFMIILVALPGWARKVAYFWGGGGEPTHLPTTIFDGDLRYWGPLLTRAGYEIRMAFGTGHIQSQKLAEQVVGTGNNDPFTVETLRRHLLDIREEIGSHRLRAGDQLILIMSTHGWDPVQTPEIATHRVSVFKEKNKEASFNMDELKPTLDLAEKAGVKVAVIDLSCYSGATISLATANVCVIAASTAEESTSSDFSKRFPDKLVVGKSLEQAFLEARKWTTDLSSPEISTFANFLVRTQIHGRIGIGTPVRAIKTCVSCSITKSALERIYNLTEFNSADIFNENDMGNQVRNMVNIRNNFKRQWPSFQDLSDYVHQAVPAYYSAERKYYEYLYRQVKNENRPNPCGSFDF